jgi:hypothetical protein
MRKMERLLVSLSEFSTADTSVGSMVGTKDRN